jgi:hypothetical protein
VTLRTVIGGGKNVIFRGYLAWREMETCVELEKNEQKAFMA